jgi:hypothetical protein
MGSFQIKARSQRGTMGVRYTPEIRFRRFPRAPQRGISRHNAEIWCYAEEKAPVSYTEVPFSTDLPR